MQKPRADLKPNTLDYENVPLVTANGFREYDARWLFGKDINLLGITALGMGLGTYLGEIGVPLKVAKCLTKPVVVNDRNRDFLLKLVQNGPDEYPGAKILEKKNGDNVSLRYVDRMSIRLDNGDVVHRHMLDGDAVLFNRQPSLHRMSMMCHIAKIMKVGDTFRMNVADTKPYNADRHIRC